MNPVQLEAYAARLLEMAAECRDMGHAIGPEAHRRGVETNGADALYQAWCLLGGINHVYAADWLRKAAAEEG